MDEQRPGRLFERCKYIYLTEEKTKMNKLVRIWNSNSSCIISAHLLSDISRVIYYSFAWGLRLV